MVDLEPNDAARLEQALVANPDDFTARLKLMAYHRRADRANLPEDHAKLVRHALWLIEHHPDSELLHSYVSQFAPDQLTPAEYQRAVALWNSAPQKSAAVQWNAASFFSGLDHGLHLHYLETTALADPDHPFALRPLAYLYASAILEPGPLTARAQAGLEASKNRWVLSNAANMFQSQYNAKIQYGVKDERAAELAERYFLRAKAIDPSMDRTTILPQLDLEAIAREREAVEQRSREFEARAKEGFLKIRRLTADAFPQLPAPVAGVLRARGCTVPQPFPDGAPRNVIRGQFFINGESGWALFCSVGDSTSLLVFRNDRDTNPDTIRASTGETYAQDWGDGRFGYSNELSIADPEDVLRRYRLMGGPKPPPLDHSVIDDAILEKASTRWYFYQGTWLQLPGAD